MPDGVWRIARMTGDLDLVHVITRERSELAAFMTQARKRTVLNGMICGS